jgi:hypothetical protein
MDSATGGTETPDPTEDVGVRPQSSERESRIRLPLVLNIAAGLILALGGYCTNSVARSVRQANELHSKGARYEVNGFTLALTDMTCVAKVNQFTNAPVDPPAQTCTATFDTFNNTNSSKDLSLDMTLYVGPAKYNILPTTGELFPNSKRQVSVSFSIAPGTAPTKLKVKPLYTSVWDILPFYEQQFVWDVR